MKKVKYHEDYYEYETAGRPKLGRSVNGLVLGVCQGLSDWSGIPVGLIRIAAIIALFATGFFPVGFFYLLLAVLLPAK